jgi:hypothetical protein
MIAFVINNQDFCIISQKYVKINLSKGRTKNNNYISINFALIIINHAIFIFKLPISYCESYCVSEA